MDKKIIKGLIDEKLEVIQEQFSIIKEYEGKIPIIEVDLLMTSIRDLYELVLSLQIENMGSVMPKTVSQPEIQKATPPPAPVTVDEPVAEAPPVTEPETTSRISSSFISMEPVTQEEPETEAPPARNFEPFIPETFLTEPAEPVPPEPEPPAPEPEPAFIPPAPAATVPETGGEMNQPHEKSPRITFDLFSEGTGATLADRLRDGQEKRIADKLQESKVVDLRTTIGINDKFLFINELFEGNMRIYDEAIQKLNASATMAQADLLLLDLKILYNWESEAPTVKKFVDLVRKKF
ncbi:MAG: hypothetical protein MUC31_07405 [Bacteroidales bacterium]|jgi:hypothetical protein|nr:hypothetical protein [Bacteroidales bacterium]